ncbi:hypothetical protein BDN67DRAFT_702735 [Paxillus ammoniavirescens]|nr:hypothetical protein BDN67DRAFT_702735 [Paxillus ammoniavirescens]
MNVTPGRHGVAITANDSRASILLDAPSRGAMSPQIPSTPCYSRKHLGSPRGVPRSVCAIQRPCNSPIDYRPRVALGSLLCICAWVVSLPPRKATTGYPKKSSARRKSLSTSPSPI